MSVDGRDNRHPGTGRGPAARRGDMDGQKRVESLCRPRRATVGLGLLVMLFALLLAAAPAGAAEPAPWMSPNANWSGTVTFTYSQSGHRPTGIPGSSETHELTGSVSYTNLERFFDETVDATVNGSELASTTWGGPPCTLVQTESAAIAHERDNTQSRGAFSLIPSLQGVAFEVYGSVTSARTTHTGCRGDSEYVNDQYRAAMPQMCRPIDLTDDNDPSLNRLVGSVTTGIIAPPCGVVRAPFLNSYYTLDSSTLTVSYDLTVNAPQTDVKCSDGTSDDFDGIVDFPLDPGCAGADDPSELSEVQCDNGRDDDADGLSDVLDPDCAGQPTGTSESTAPIVRFSFDRSMGERVLNVRFDASGSQHVTRYIWDFGDGSPLLATTSPIAEHRYEISVDEATQSDCAGLGGALHADFVPTLTGISAGGRSVSARGAGPTDACADPATVTLTNRWTRLLSSALLRYQLALRYGRHTAGYHHQILHLICAATRSNATRCGSLRRSYRPAIRPGSDLGPARWAGEWIHAVFAAFLPVRDPRQAVREINRAAAVVAARGLLCAGAAIAPPGRLFCTFLGSAGAAGTTAAGVGHFFTDLDPAFAAASRAAVRRLGPNPRPAALRRLLGGPAPDGLRSQHEGLFTKAVLPGFDHIPSSELPKLARLIAQRAVPFEAERLREHHFCRALQAVLGKTRGLALYLQAGGTERRCALKTAFGP